MFDALSHAWPWYVSGPLIGLFVPALLLLGNRQFGISSNLRHLCAAVAPAGVDFFAYDWRKLGRWNLAFLAGIVAGGALASVFVGSGDVAISGQTRDALMQLGIRSFDGLAPADIFSWSSLLSPRGALIVIGGGFLVGFGSAYAGGCTSGHAISGLAVFERASLVATMAFFAGGLLCTYFVLPLLF